MMTHADVSVNEWPRGLFGGFFSRVVAFWIDQALVSALRAIVLFTFDYLSLSSGVSGGMTFIVKSLIVVSYFTVVTFITNGWTVGKALMGLRTIALDGRSLSLTTALVREGVGKMILMHFPFLGLIVLFSEQRENFMDFFTDTRVVSERRLALIDCWQATEGKENQS
ncbi:MAG: RDD family protein [Aerococcus sp.]|nr:RDD family protein [Aerococcus sp.]